MNAVRVYALNHANMYGIGIVAQNNVHKHTCINTENIFICPLWRNLSFSMSRSIFVYKWHATFVQTPESDKSISNYYT